MITWILYCAVAGMLIAIAARSAEYVVRVVGQRATRDRSLARDGRIAIGLPVRWIWVAALALVFAFAAVAPLRRAAPEVPVPATSTPIAFDALQLEAGIGAVSRRLPSSATMIATTTWGLASVFLLAVIAGVHLRLRVARRRWPLVDFHGSRARVSPDAGPLVIGLRRPEIVVPQWILDRPAHEQRVIIAHEAEHLRSNDNLLLAGGAVALALMPWNPAVWYLFSRLRLAVELDCDARVLGRGVTVHSYGSLLLDVAMHASPLRFGAAALANSPSHLRQRIIAMQPVFTKFAHLRAGAVALLGLAALVLACGSEMPTAAEIEAMDVDLVEQKLARTFGQDSNVVYLVDGRQVVSAEAIELRAADIVGIEIVRSATEPTKIVISTRNGIDRQLFVRAEAVGTLRGTGDMADELKKSLSGSGAASNSLRSTAEQRARIKGEPLYVIDGKRATADDVKTLDRHRIESIEILKGGAAERFRGYTAAEVANGVVLIYTKN
jgi:hypothetical protein